MSSVRDGFNIILTKGKKMIIQETISFDNRPIFILSKTQDKTKDAIDSFHRPWLEQLKKHAESGGFFYTVSPDEIINGLCKIYTSQDLFTINAKINSLGRGHLMNQIFMASAQQIKTAKKKGHVVIL